MAELEDVTLDGKQLNSLRVADLKSALEQRGLPKSGQKNALIKRLKGALMLENLQRTATPHMGLQPNSQIGEEMSQNSFIKQYLAKQQELLRQRLEREARGAIEADDSPTGPDEDDHTKGSDITSCSSDQRHSLASAPSLVEEVMSAEASVLLPRSSAPTASQLHAVAGSPDPGPQGAPPCAVASLSVHVLPGATPAPPGLQLSQPRDDSEEDEESEQEWSVRPRRGGQSQPTWERSRRKQQPPQHIPPQLQLRQPTLPPSPPPDPSFPLPDTPKQSPPSLERPEGGAAPHSPGPLSTMESEGATITPPMESAGPSPPIQPPQEATAVSSTPGGVAIQSHRDQKVGQSPRAEKGRESLEEVPLSSLSPLPDLAPKTPGSGSPSAPPLAETCVDPNREPTLPEDQTAHVAMDTEASTEPVLPPSPPPEEGDPSSSNSDSGSESSSPSLASSPSQEKSCLAPACQREDSGPGESGALCKSGGSPNAPLPPPRKKRGEQPPEEEAGAGHKKKPRPERGGVDEEVRRRPQTREVKEAGSVLEVEKACTEGQCLAEGAVGSLEESTTTKAFAARKISLTTTSKATPGGGVISVGALTLAPVVAPLGPPEEVESGGSAGRKRRWGSSTAATGKKPSISITTDSLKCLIPDIKPAAGPGSQEAVVELHPEEGCLSGGEEEGAELKICRTVTQVVPAENQENGQKKREEEEGYEGVGVDGQNMLKEERKDGSTDVALEMQAAPTSKMDAKKVTPSDMLVRRSVSQQKSGVSVTIDDPVHTTRQPSPPHGKITNIVHVCNLVRPFTLGQLKELLNRTGTMVEEAFWIDKIKSHCYVTYSCSDEAMATRIALHGVKWPQSNPKLLSVDFCEQDELDFHRGVLVVMPGAAEGGVPAGVPQPPPSLLPERERGRERERGEERGRERERGEERGREREGGEERGRDRERAGGDQWAQREREMERRERARMEREWDRDKVCDLTTPWEEKEGRRSRSRDRERRRKERKTDKKVEEPSAKLLDDLFCKTKASPCIYWLPLTEQQALQREAERSERMKEREKRRKEQQQEEDKKREEERRERVKGRDKEAGGVAGVDGASRGTEGEREGEREKEREREGKRERERGKAGEGDKRRDSYRGRGAERRSRSHSNPPPPRDRRH